ncbi:HAAS signaling domain-containing protein [Streptomyces sp. NPDC008150]|uniref:HAAS signaling domain-containing protein n=1 Tax=Streptomyces sp. NPDC008150 TaxID=3364816 RepID=UPI0036EBDC49
MGIESDQVVYEYLSRVGDVAHQRQLPSGARMRLVAGLREEIDRRRAGGTADTPAAVRRILDRLGSPDDVVTAAGATGDVRRESTASVPLQRDRGDEDDDGGRPKGLRRVVPRPRPRTEPAAPAVPDAPSPPHLAAEHEMGDPAAQPDWWRVDSSPFGLGDQVPGFVGGIEIPELLKPPPPKEPERPAVPAQGTGTDPAAKAAAPGPVEAAPVKRRLVRRLLPVRAAGAGTGTGWSNPLLLLAAGALVVGAVLGNWFVLALGWLVAYGSRRLTATESKWAVVGMPGLAVAGGIVWLWGRSEGRWGTLVAQGQMGDAVSETWPWVVRAAAVLSALYVVWRSQRTR